MIKVGDTIAVRVPAGSNFDPWLMTVTAVASGYVKAAWFPRGGEYRFGWYPIDEVEADAPQRDATKCRWLERRGHDGDPEATRPRTSPTGPRSRRGARGTG